MNALAAAAAAFALGVSQRSIVAGLSGFAGVKGRLQKKPALHGSHLHRRHLQRQSRFGEGRDRRAGRQPGKKVLVLGDMGELGADARAHARAKSARPRAGGRHRPAARAGRSERRKPSRAFGAGAMHFERIEELLAELENELAPDTTVLVKGSRFMQMERVVQKFRMARRHEDSTCCSS